MQIIFKLFIFVFGDYYSQKFNCIYTKKNGNETKIIYNSR